MSKAYERRKSNADPKGDRRSRTITPAAEPPQPLGYELTDRGMLSLEALVALQDLLMRGDGWVRLTSTLDMKTVYGKYKYSSGRNRGKYVMAVFHFDQLAWGLCLLAHKVGQVDMGELAASHDTFYDWKD